ncbi:uncharacterized protein LOC144530914 [Sander vitreus]
MAMIDNVINNSCPNFIRNLSPSNYTSTSHSDSSSSDPSTSSSHTHLPLTSSIHMAGLCWMAVVLAFSLSVGNTEAMDQDEVQTIVNFILNKYFITNNQFSLAVNIPVNQDLNNLQDLFNADNAIKVIEVVTSGEVYKDELNPGALTPLVRWVWADVNTDQTLCAFLLTVFTAATPCLQTQRTTASEASSNIFLHRKKMAGLCWMAGVLAFSLSVGNTEAMDQNKVQTIVNFILNKYLIPNKQFSLAVNIPVNQDLKKLQDLFNADNAITVKMVVQREKVYKGTNVVEALPLKGNKYTEHAEARVLDNIKPLADSSKGKSLVFYSYLSPCGAKCTNPNNYNILDKINYIPKDRWADSAFVFSKVFDGYKDPNGKWVYFTLEEIRDTLKNLGTTKFGRNNIFRCRVSYDQTHCIKCFSNDSPEPVDGCVKNYT